METRGKVERFEDLIAWQKVRVLTREIYRESAWGVRARLRIGRADAASISFDHVEYRRGI